MPTFPVPVITESIYPGPNQTVFFPRAIYMRNLVTQHKMNQTIIQEAQKLIRKQIENMPSTVIEMIGSYEIKNNQRNVLSLTLSNYTYHDKAAHGMTYLTSLTFDVDTGKKYSLAQLFKPGSHYIDRLSSLIQQQIKERDIPLIHEFTAIRPDQDFYIADKTLVIYFQLYELTPYVYGFPIFPISVYDLQDIIEEKGPLAKMLVNN